MTFSLDDTTLAILKALQQNARLTNAEIAKSVGCAQSTVSKKIKLLIDSGIIKNFRCNVDIGKTDNNLMDYALIKFKSQHKKDKEQFLKKINLNFSQVLEVHIIAGNGSDCLIKVLTKTRADYLDVIEKLSNLGNCARIDSFSVISTEIDRTPDPELIFFKRRKRSR